MLPIWGCFITFTWWRLQVQYARTTCGSGGLCVKGNLSARLAREWRDDGIHSYALHPGVVASDVWRHAPRPIAAIAKLFMLSNEEGAQTSLYCATDPGCAEESGLYYAESRPKEPSALARDPKLQDELWRRSLEWTGLA